MQSNRFEKDVHLSRHARERMYQRAISEALLQDLLETGTIKYKDAAHLWIAKSFDARTDNLICAAVVLEDKLVVKTVMHYFKWENDQ